MNNEELLKTYFANRHILQSPEWGEFKTLMGTRAITVQGSEIKDQNLQFTLHRLPFLPWQIGYCPKVKPEDLDLEKLYEVGKRENCIFVKLDVPHASREFKIQSSKFKVVEGKSIFAQSTVLIDLTKSDQELLTAMNEKTRYNIGLATRKGVHVEVYPDDPQGHPLRMARGGLKDALDEFISLQKETARRQKFFVHPDYYYKNCFELLSNHQMAYLLEAAAPSRLPESTDETPGVSRVAASWLLFRSGDILYYPYGESNYELRNYMPSNALMWEAIQLGKKLGCKVFDLWGAAADPNDEKNPWHGFTRFKLSSGGLHVKLAPTYDLVINQPLYNLFTNLDKLRWSLLRKIR